MKIMRVEQLKSGMKLGMEVVNQDTGIELIARGATLTDKYIAMLMRSGVEYVYITEEEAVDEEVYTSDEVLKQIEAVEQEIKELDDLDFSKIEVKSRFKNLHIHVLTGEGGLPIDERHEEEVARTKELFDRIRTSATIDIDQVKDDVKELIPDFIRNNDVLSRIHQLKESNDRLFGHSFRVSILATMIGRWLGLGWKELEELGEAALLHDIGIQKLPPFMANLMPNELEVKFDVFKQHPKLGYSILLKTKGVSQDVKYAVLHHHERMNGTGYPLRIRENQIHYYAKIIMVADVYDNLTYYNLNRKDASPIDAVEHLLWNAGELYDPIVVQVFVKNLSAYYVSKEVELSTGEIGQIIYIDQGMPTKPIIKTPNRIVNLMEDHYTKIIRFVLDKK